MGDKLGNGADVDRLLVSSGMSAPIFTVMPAPIFTVIENEDLWSCTDFYAKISGQKLATLRILAYVGEVEAGSQHVWTCIPRYTLLGRGQFFQFPSPNLQWLTERRPSDHSSVLRLIQLSSNRKHAEKTQIPPTPLETTLALLERQSRFGDKSVIFRVICAENGAAVLKGQPLWVLQR